MRSQVCTCGLVLELSLSKLMVFFFTQDFIRTTLTDRHMKEVRTTWMIVENVLELGKSHSIFSSKTQAILLSISFFKRSGFVVF